MDKIDNIFNTLSNSQAEILCERSSKINKPDKKKPASECLSFLCGKYGFVLADKIIFACKHYYYVIKELRTSNHTENPVLTMKKSRQITSQCRRQ